MRINPTRNISFKSAKFEGIKLPEDPELKAFAEQRIKKTVSEKWGGLNFKDNMQTIADNANRLPDGRMVVTVEPTIALADNCMFIDDTTRRGLRQRRTLTEKVPVLAKIPGLKPGIQTERLGLSLGVEYTPGPQASRVLGSDEPIRYSTNPDYHFDFADTDFKPVAEMSGFIANRYTERAQELSGLEALDSLTGSFSPERILGGRIDTNQVADMLQDGISPGSVQQICDETNQEIVDLSAQGQTIGTLKALQGNNHT